MTHSPEQSIYPVLAYFRYEHLPASLREVSRPFAELAMEMAIELPAGPEVSAGLRKLLEAKDCMVRAALDGSDDVTTERIG